MEINKKELRVVEKMLVAFHEKHNALVIKRYAVNCGASCAMSCAYCCKESPCTAICAANCVAGCRFSAR